MALVANLPDMPLELHQCGGEKTGGIVEFCQLFLFHRCCLFLVGGIEPVSFSFLPVATDR